jgi:antitoxin PrlF
MSDIITMSSKGQIVIPKNLREQLGIDTGANFAIFGEEDTVVLKKIKVPTAKEAFEKLHNWGVKLAKEKGLKEDDVMKKIHAGRGIKSE